MYYFLLGYEERKSKKFLKDEEKNKMSRLEKLDFSKEKNVITTSLNYKQKTLYNSNIYTPEVVLMLYNNIKNLSDYNLKFKELNKLHEDIIGSQQFNDSIPYLSFLKVNILWKNSYVLRDILMYLRVCYSDWHRKILSKTDNANMQQLSASEIHELDIESKQYKSVNIESEITHFISQFIDLVSRHWKIFFCYIDEILRNVKSEGHKIQKIDKSISISYLKAIPKIYVYYYPFYLNKINISGCFVVYGYNVVEAIQLINFFDSVIDDVEEAMAKYNTANPVYLDKNQKERENAYSDLFKILTWALRSGFTKYDIKSHIQANLSKQTLEDVLKNMKIDKYTYQKALKTKNKIQVHILFPAFEIIKSNNNEFIEKTRIFIGFQNEI
ncbi:hypothetical protein EDEG_01029 [Edhazardia aedis USNM 41457]|uniref:Uncharacterized protein n=1 Tax=Edhazardia aedis (strain USNM 41457) TaxID=1003232 RepID=J9DB70_EDHAE|nr:hypothetical protein EDEG_01029 [Edhazardia aedis USNM 41457]|eukprot:EJW04739.1 hypothetical protein EDEG_01029 [Edhazardia aedis USNM 41457]